MATPMPDESTVFNAACRIADPAARRRYVAGACGGDPAFAARVEALLRMHDEDPNFLASSAQELGDFLGTPNESPIRCPVAPSGLPLPGPLRWPLAARDYLLPGPRWLATKFSVSWGAVAWESSLRPRTLDSVGGSPSSSSPPNTQVGADAQVPSSRRPGLRRQSTTRTSYPFIMSEKATASHSSSCRC